MSLQNDKYGFVIVRKPSEITEAKQQGHEHVKCQCFECKKEILTTPGVADLIMENGCMKHQNLFKKSVPVSYHSIIDHE